MLSKILEQRINLKFLVKLNKSKAECFEMLRNVYGDECMGKTTFYEWFKRFKEGREDVEDDQRSGRPTTSNTEDNVEKIAKIIRNDRRLSVKMVADMVNINRETVRQILHDKLNMKKVCAKMVPKNLSAEQKERRKEVCVDSLQTIENDPGFLEKVITCDETWIFQYDPETKRQSMHWKTPGTPRSKKARMSKSKFKAMLTVFFDIKGIILAEWVPEGQTVNQTYYIELLNKLRERIRKKRPELWSSGDWVLHHDNAPAHTALSVRRFLADKKITVLEHSPYSPDLAPCDFFLFPKIKSQLKGTHFESIEVVKRKTAELLKAVTLDELRHCFNQWKTRMQACVDSQGEYIEGEHH